MREREEIEELSDKYQATGQLQLVVELLLDIRELLRESQDSHEKSCNCDICQGSQ